LKATDKSVAKLSLFVSVNNFYDFNLAIYCQVVCRNIFLLVRKWSRHIWNYFHFEQYLDYGICYIYSKYLWFYVNLIFSGIHSFFYTFNDFYMHIRYISGYMCKSGTRVCIWRNKLYWNEKRKHTSSRRTNPIYVLLIFIVTQLFLSFRYFLLISPWLCRNSRQPSIPAEMIVLEMLYFCQIQRPKPIIFVIVVVYKYLKIERHWYTHGLVSKVMYLCRLCSVFSLYRYIFVHICQFKLRVRRVSLPFWHYKSMLTHIYKKLLVCCVKKGKLLCMQHITCI
jgi:hypothetical protein